jgi:hypothetical protein
MPDFTCDALAICGVAIAIVLIGAMLLSKNQGITFRR